MSTKTSTLYKASTSIDCDIYEDEIYDFLFSIVKPVALEWIEKHVPKAWFKENFVDEKQLKNL